MFMALSANTSGDKGREGWLSALLFFLFFICFICVSFSQLKILYYGLNSLNVYMSCKQLNRSSKDIQRTLPSEKKSFLFINSASFLKKPINARDKVSGL